MRDSYAMVKSYAAMREKVMVRLRWLYRIITKTATLVGAIAVLGGTLLLNMYKQYVERPTVDVTVLPFVVPNEIRANYGVAVPGIDGNLQNALDFGKSMQSFAIIQVRNPRPEALKGFILQPNDNKTICRFQVQYGNAWDNLSPDMEYVEVQKLNGESEVMIRAWMAKPPDEVFRSPKAWSELRKFRVKVHRPTSPKTPSHP